MVNNDPIVEELNRLTDELNAMTDKSYNENHEFVPGQITAEDRKRHREITVRLRELHQKLR